MSSTTADTSRAQRRILCIGIPTRDMLLHISSAAVARPQASGRSVQPVQRRQRDQCGRRDRATRRQGAPDRTDRRESGGHPVHPRPAGRGGHRTAAPRARAGRTDADVDYLDRRRWRAHARDPPRPETLDRRAAGHRRLARRRRCHFDREPLRRLRHRDLPQARERGIPRCSMPIVRVSLQDEISDGLQPCHFFGRSVEGDNRQG